MTATGSEEVFAHVAPSLRFDGKSLTLVDIAPSTIRMSRASTSMPSGDAPELSYLPTGAFLDRWAELAGRVGPDFCMRGTLSLLDPDAQLAGSAVVELRNPRMTAEGLAYDARVVEGIVPGGSGACVLFLEWTQAPAVGADAPDQQQPGRQPTDQQRRAAP